MFSAALGDQQLHQQKGTAVTRRQGKKLLLSFTDLLPGMDVVIILQTWEDYRILGIFNREAKVRLDILLTSKPGIYE